MAGSCVWGVDREAIEQWGNTMCVLLVVLCGDCRGAYFFLGNIFPAGSVGGRADRSRDHAFEMPILFAHHSMNTVAQKVLLTGRARIPYM